MANFCKAKEEFAEKECEDFICTICLCIPSPLFAEEAICCGSFFCTPCLTSSRERKQVCPNCNGSFAALPPRSVHHSNIFVYRKLNNLLVYCENKFKERPPNSQEIPECEWIGAWGDTKQHLKTCNHSIVSCSWNYCRVSLPLFCLSQHESVCEYRTASCQYCFINLPFIDIQKHLQKCDKVPVSCECGEGGLIRQSFNYHKLYICPFSVSFCNNSGCRESVRNRDKEAHSLVCNYRQTICNFCSCSVSYNLLPNHFSKECNEVKVGCPFECSIETMERKKLPQHLFECPKRLENNTNNNNTNSNTNTNTNINNNNNNSNPNLNDMFMQMQEMRQAIQELTATTEQNKITIDSLKRTVSFQSDVIASLSRFRNNVVTSLRNQLCGKG